MVDRNAGCNFIDHICFSLKTWNKTSRLKRPFIILAILYFGVQELYGQSLASRSGHPNVPATPAFYLYYGQAGLGSNLGDFEPTINIRGSNLEYTLQQNSWFGKRSNRIETICVTAFRQSSIDSIIDILKNVKDSSIFESNFCVMSGSIYYLTISDGVDTTRFSLMNTFHYTALKITNILNTYLPKNKLLRLNEEMIKAQDDCLKYLKEELRKRSESN